MFTGIVQGIRKVSNILDYKNIRSLSINLGDLANNLNLGASICVNGVCLTVKNLEKNIAEFDIIFESLNRSNLGLLKFGDYVNIERACRLGDELGGHHVSGHIDCTGVINKIIKKENIHNIFVTYDINWKKYLFSKGWISLDGTSLTIVDVKEDYFSISLIPETIKRTILGQKNINEKVNIEFDYTAKVIVDTLKRIIPNYK